MADEGQGAQTPAWFEQGGNAGQDGASGEGEGPALEVDDEGTGEEMHEVAPSELQPSAAELKTKDEKPQRRDFKIPAAEITRRAPAWAKVPKGMRFPKGIQVVFMRIRAGLTMYPSKGDRQVILWPLTDGDEKLAIGRSMSNAARAGVEMAKQMIRGIDGEPVNWTGDPNAPGADVDRFWHEIGPKGRNLLQRVFTQLHAMNEDELVDFFEHCISVVSTG
jgi:hypothetical protein